MAGKSPWGTRKKESKLRNLIYQADPDELRLEPNESIAVVPLHGVMDGYEFEQHAISYQFQGRWGKAVCNAENGDCPFCEDQREEVSRTLIRTAMLMIDPKSEKVLYYVLPIAVTRMLMKWEQDADDGLSEGEPTTVRGRRIVISREGSGIGTKYLAVVYNDVTGKLSLEPYQDEINRVAEKVKKNFQPTDPDTQRAILAGAKLQLKGKGGDSTEDDQPEPATVEEESW
jgi:hypothetical protein